MNAASSSSWTEGGAALVYQHCPACSNRWYFKRDFCPACGNTEPATQALGGLGVVHASTLVHRAPSDEFRAIAPYRLVLVDMAEGLRVMAHGEAGLVIGDCVRGSVRVIAGRPLPYFERDKAR